MKHWLLVLSAGLMLPACDRDIPMVNLGIDDMYYIRRMCKLDLHPALTGERYEWRVNGSVVSRERDYIFLSRDEGDYTVNIRIIDSETPYDFTFDVHVLHGEIEYSPYISRVYEYCPAPGQFINKMPWYDEGDTAEDMRRKAEEALSGTNEEMVSLGAFGGYITFGFDHTVVNVDGEYDFMILGNAFYDAGMEDEKSGSCEPGIVMVSLDVNGNGLPDDEWYELAGSEYGKDTEIRNYEITYYRPQLVNGDVRWTDNQGKEGLIKRNTFHQQDSYYPNWIEEDEITFHGTRLKDNAVEEGNVWVGYCYPWGYADNHPNKTEYCQFKIDWAVDPNGQPVLLDKIDFVKIYTAVNQDIGWTGEISTEFVTVENLHYKK